ncbi:MAG: hypothetical protein JWR36_760 [Glaciihabitans sp.]|nr:hypothetical protein [Glaciihabitans sp.]
MTDSPWQSPSGEERPQTPPEFGGFGAPPPAPPGYPQAPVYPPFPGGQGAWAPPPKPGLIALRPQGLGDILGASFKVLRRNPRPVVGVSLIIKLIVAVITIGTMGLLTVSGVSSAINAADPNFTQFGLGQLVQTEATSIVTLILGIVADAILQGIITLEVARGTLGEKLPLSALWRRARGRVWALIGWAAAVGGALLAAFLIVFVAIIALVALGGPAGIAFGILLGVLVAIGGLVLSFWLGTKLSMVPSALVLERVKLGAAIKRSWSLTRGYFWRTLGIELLVAVIVAVAAGIVLTPVGIVVALLTLSTQTSVTDPVPVGQTSILTFAITTLVSAIVGAITAIISTAADSLIYIDLRIRKEGLDLDLLRFVEARDSGATDIPDPYLVSASRTEPTPTSAADSHWA